MELLNTFLVAIALAMDTLAVSISSGANLVKIRIREVLLISVYFSFFHFLMPVLGWQGGKFLNSFIQIFDHWAAFVLLVFIGVKMIWDSFRNDHKKILCLNHSLLLLLAFSVSIDALGIGISYAFLDRPIIIPALIIGLVTFFFSILGLYLGKNLKNLLSGKATLLGGAILILIGFKILIDHGVFLNLFK